MFEEIINAKKYFGLKALREKIQMTEHLTLILDNRI
jgi:hypothetical protein